MQKVWFHLKEPRVRVHVCTLVADACGNMCKRHWKGHDRTLRSTLAWHRMRRKDERRRITVYKPQASKSRGHAIDLAFAPTSEAALDAHFKVSRVASLVVQTACAAYHAYMFIGA